MSSEGKLVKGIIVSSFRDDPQSANRVQVYIPAVHGSFDGSRVGTIPAEQIESSENGMIIDKYPWAQCSTQMGLYSIPVVGSTVWIMFENNDPTFPVVIGMHTAGIDVNDNDDINGTLSKFGIQGSGFSSGSLAEIAAEIIFGNEGGYDTINWNDNGAISIGKIQWHANKARDLLKKIREANTSSFDRLASRTSLISDLSANWSNWKNYSANCPAGKALKIILGTDESKKVQDEEAMSYVHDYISEIQKRGVTDPQCIIYLADMANQGPAYAYRIAEYAASNGINTLDALHRAVSEGKPATYGWINDSRGLPRRNRTYQAIKVAENQGKFTMASLSGMSGTDGSRLLLWPAPKIGTITSKYGYRGAIAGTSHSGTHFHNGIDIGCPTGTSIIASAEGTVTVSSFNTGGYGNYIVIYHPRLNLRTLYAHGTSRIVNVGQQVRAGQVILKSGSTGNSSGPHLHYTVAKGESGSMGSSKTGPGQSVNPESYVAPPF